MRGARAACRLLATTALLGAGLTGLGPPASGAPAAGTTTRMSVPNVEGDRRSQVMAISGDGRHVAFVSESTNLVPGDTNGRNDVFVRDRLLGTIERVSVSSEGIQGNNSVPGGKQVSITTDGRYVAFTAFSDNLVPGDTNVQGDVFVHDRQTRVTTRVSLDTGGGQRADSSDQPVITSDGRYVAFIAGPRLCVSCTTDVFVHDRQSGQTARVGTPPVAAPLGASEATISDDGRFVAFASMSSGVVAGDANGTFDIFLHDRVTATTERISVSSGGGEANGASRSPSISGDGRLIGFSSEASNLVEGDTNGAGDVFVYDRQTGVITRASVTSDGGQGTGGSGGPDLTTDGSGLSFASLASDLVSGDTNGGTDVFFHDRATGSTTRVSVADDGAQSQEPTNSFHAVSDDGTFVAFATTAKNLVPGDTNGEDVFVRDRAAAATVRVSVAAAGQADGASSQPSISGDGTMVAFSSDATNLVQADTNELTDVFFALHGGPGSSPISASARGASAEPSISGDGRFVAFSSVANNLVTDDTNGSRDVFVRDRSRFSSHTTRISDPDGPAQAVGNSVSPAISGDGRFVAFASTAPNLVPGDSNSLTDVFVHDREDGTTARVSVKGAGTQANGASTQPSISGDGRFVAFTSTATNLVKGDTNGVADVFVRDLVANTTTRVSVSAAGAQATRASDNSAISADGALVAFRSDAGNLVAGDTNGAGDVFVRDRAAVTTTRVSVASGGAQSAGASWSPAVSADGSTVAFVSQAPDLVAGDTNGVADVFVHDRAAATTTRVSVASGGAQADRGSKDPSLNGNGSIVAFVSKATNLVPGDTNTVADVYIHAR